MDARLLYILNVCAVIVYKWMHGYCIYMYARLLYINGCTVILYKWMHGDCI